MSKKIGDLAVMDRMATGNKDIRVGVLPKNLINVRRTKGGGEVLIGVDTSCASILMNMALGQTEYGAALYIVKWSDFNEIKAEMAREVEKSPRYVALTLTPDEIDKLDFTKPGARMHVTSKESGDYDKSIHTNPDADAWARFYVERHPESDLDDMRGWFANAMMAMHDYLLAGRSEIEEKYRYRLWMAYPDPDGVKYGDDGEMQLAGLDFKRAPLEDLEKAFDQARIAASARRAQTDSCCAICKMPLIYEKGQPTAHCQNGHKSPLPVSDWPANCDACTLNEELIGGDDCAGCPNKPEKA